MTCPHLATLRCQVLDGFPWPENLYMHSHMPLSKCTWVALTLRKALRLNLYPRLAMAVTPPGPGTSTWVSASYPRVEEVSVLVDGWFLRHWPFANEKAKKKFVAAGFSRATCLYFPLARDDRIASACKLLTILFLIDGKLPYKSYIALLIIGLETFSRACHSKMAGYTTRISCPLPRTDWNQIVCSRSLYSTWLRRC